MTGPGSAAGVRINAAPTAPTCAYPLALDFGRRCAYMLAHKLFGWDPDAGALVRGGVGPAEAGLINGVVDVAAPWILRWPEHAPLAAALSICFCGNHIARCFCR